MWTHALNTLLGIWLMAAPAVLGYGGAAMDNDRIAGPIAATFACVAIWQVTRSGRWVCTLAGLWLVAAPWVLPDYTRAATLNSMLCGAAIVVLSLVRGKYDESKFGGGWKYLWKDSLELAPRT